MIQLSCPDRPRRLSTRLAAVVPTLTLAALLSGSAAHAQQAQPPTPIPAPAATQAAPATPRSQTTAPATKPANPLATPATKPAAPTGSAPAAAATTRYQPSPAFDLTSMNPAADPCADFYQFACGNFAAHHPIPADQPDVDQFSILQNVNLQNLNGILSRLASATGATASSSEPNTPAPTTPSSQPDAQLDSQQDSKLDTKLDTKLGGYYAACMNSALIEAQDLQPIQPLLGEIDRVTKFGLVYLAGELQRMGVNVLFGFGEAQDFKDSTQQVAFLDQGGLGLPDRDYYTRTGAKDEQVRHQYVEHVTNILSFAGEPPQQALVDARNILAFETTLAQASMTITERRNPEAIYHPQTLEAFEKTLHGVPFAPFLKAVHAPPLQSVVVANPAFFPAMVSAVMGASLPTLRAYLRYHLLTTYASELPQRLDDENFKFYRKELQGQPEQAPRWKRCTRSTDGALGEALGELYVAQYFPASSKASTLQMVHDIESAMNRDIDTLDWMSPATKVRAKEKLKAVAEKIGYPNHWRDYSKLAISPDAAFANSQHANEFENDRELDKIGKPVDRGEWGMTPPTVNAYYDPSMNDINFPAGILQPAFYDPDAGTAVNYGHVGAVIGHELTHGFDDEGRKFDAHGNLADWWTPEDVKKFEARTSCLVKEYSGFTAVDTVMVNGQNTLGENTADNGGLVLAYMAYLDRAKETGIDMAEKVDGYTGPQRFYVAYAQNWCTNVRPEYERELAQTDVHSPDHIRVNGVLVNQPGFASAFSCKRPSPMVPPNSCRVW